MDTKEKNKNPGTRPKQTEQGSTGAKRRAVSRSAEAPRKRTAAPAAGENTRRRTRPVGDRQPERKRAPAPRKDPVPTPDVVYTPAKPFSRNRFLLRLATVVAVVVAMIFGISIFFKVDKVTVSGANKYTPWMVMEASGIKEGENLLTLDKVRASGKIIAGLPYVESVRIGIQLPDTVNIEIVEMDVVYAVKDSGDFWWLITSDGKIAEKVDSATAGEHTKILGVRLASPVSGGQAEAADMVVGTYTDENGNALDQTISGGTYLSTALSIAQYLEECGIIGQVASIDVTSLTDIELWYGQRYQVKLGDTTQLGYKISFMNSAINGENGLQDYDSGVLDITFRTQEGIVYEAFD